MDTRTEKALSQSARDIAETGEEMSEEIAETTRGARRRMSEAWQHARDRVQDETRAGVEVTDRTLREHPYASLTTGFCLGLLLGVLLSRRH